MFLAIIPAGENPIWLLFCGVLFVGSLVYLLVGKIRSRRAVKTVQAATPVDENLVEPPQVCVGIPPNVLARIHEACGGQIKDGELDIRFELRSRRDCDKMIAMLREMTAALQRTKSVISEAESGASAQLAGQLAAGRLTTARVLGMVSRQTQSVVLPAHREQYIAAKRAELAGYETANRLVEKFMNELHLTEASLVQLPLYTHPNTATIPLPRLSNEPRVA